MNCSKMFLEIARRGEALLALFTLKAFVWSLELNAVTKKNTRNLIYGKNFAAQIPGCCNNSSDFVKVKKSELGNPSEMK